MSAGATRLATIWLWIVVVILYVPILVVGLASLSRSRFFTFPIRDVDTKWYAETFASMQVEDAVITSALIAIAVALISVVMAFFGALAFARYRWRGRPLFQQLLLVPVFFPQAVLGLALQLWFNTLGITMSWPATVLAQLVWIAPIVTLIIAIQAFGYDPSVEEAARDLGASNWQVMRDITFPLLGPGVFTGFLFALLLSWGNFPLAYFTSGADVSIPEWIYGKMIGGYTPMVPAVGFLSAVVGAILLTVGLVLKSRIHRA